MRILGLDIGERHIGVAISDPCGILASPLMIIDCQGDDTDIEAISAIVKEREIGMVIVGLPLSMDGKMGEQAMKANEFAANLQQHIEVDVKLRDERLTTVSARRLMEDVGSKKRHQRHSHHDAVAAAIILQAYLEEGIEGY